MRKFWKSLHGVHESCAHSRAVPILPAPCLSHSLWHIERTADTMAGIPGWQDAGVRIVKVCKHPLDLLVCHCWRRGSRGGYETISKILLL